MSKKVCGFLLIVCLLLILIGCQETTDEVETIDEVERMLASIAEQEQENTGSKETERPASASGDYKWPSDIPGYVPQLKGVVADIKEASSTEEYSQYYHIIFEDIEDTADSYEEKLISNGWTIIVTTDLEEIWAINAKYEDDTAYLTVTVEKEKSGDFVLGIVR